MHADREADLRIAYRGDVVALGIIDRIVVDEDRVDRIRREVDEEGLMVESSHGVKAHPGHTMADHLEKTVVSSWRALASRKAVVDHDSDDLDKLLAPVEPHRTVNKGSTNF